MATLVQRVKEPPHPCPYLPGRTASLDVAVMLDVSAEELGALLERGWRRFGPAYFRPACRGCHACVSLRIPSATFHPSRSQKRARRAAARLTREVNIPIVDEERVALYARWHAQREAHRGWEPNGIDAERYALEFAFEHPAVREVTFRDPAHGHRLVGLGIIDDVPDGLSAVIFFWDPEFAPPSLGVAHIVCLVEDAVRQDQPYVYLGYRVEQCASLAYKGRFEPHETLIGRPGSTSASWQLQPVVRGRPEASASPEPHTAG